MQRFVFCLGLSCIFAITPALADDNIAIPQVSAARPITHPKADTGLPAPDEEQNNANPQDHQLEILSNPVISNVGRANNVLQQAGSSANTTVVIQNGQRHENTAEQVDGN